MPLDYSIPSKVKLPDLPSRLDTLTDMAKEDAIKLARQKSIQDAADEAAVRTAFKTHTDERGVPDFEGIIGDLYKTNPTAALKVREQHQKMIEEATKQHTAELDQHDKEAALLSKAFTGVDASTYDDTRKMIVAWDPDAAQQIPEQYDPQAVARLSRVGVDVKTRNEMEREAAKLLASGDLERGAAAAISLSTSPEDFENNLDQIALYNKRASDKWRAMGFSPETIKTAREQSLTEKDRQTLANTATDNQRQADALTEAKRHNLAEEGIQRQNAATAAKNAAGGGTGGAASTIEPGTPAFKVAQDLAYGRITPSFFRTLQAYNRDANKKEALYAKATELNPNFNEADFERGFKFISSPRIGSQLAALDNSLSGIPSLLEASDKAKRSGFPILNTWAIQPFKTAIGNKSYSNFKTAVTAFADELSGALGYGSATDMAREMGFNMTDMSQSPSVFASNMQDIVVPFVERKRASLLKQGSVYGQSGNNSSVSNETSGQTITMAELAAVARLKGTSVDVQKQRYLDAGYTIK